jgi:hypothetical protein
MLDGESTYPYIDEVRWLEESHVTVLTVGCETTVDTSDCAGREIRWAPGSSVRWDFPLDFDGDGI